MFDRSTWIGWILGIVLIGGVMTVGAISGWSSQTLGGAFILTLILTIAIADPLEARYRARHGSDPRRQV